MKQYHQLYLMLNIIFQNVVTRKAQRFSRIIDSLFDNAKRLIKRTRRIINGDISSSEFCGISHQI